MQPELQTEQKQSDLGLHCLQINEVESYTLSLLKV